uniref:SET domain-containing protein n=1 Tax=Macrostomum lignano TaxID=282301 RepID=A0A1I8F8J9_9PLAT
MLPSAPACPAALCWAPLTSKNFAAEDDQSSLPEHSHMAEVRRAAGQRRSLREAAAAAAARKIRGARQLPARASSSSSSSNGCHVPDWPVPGGRRRICRAEDYGKLMVRYVELEDARRGGGLQATLTPQHRQQPQSLSRDDCLNSFHTYCSAGAASSTTASSIRSSPRRACTSAGRLWKLPGPLLRGGDSCCQLPHRPRPARQILRAQVASFIRREANLKRRGADRAVAAAGKKRKVRKKAGVNGGRRAPGQQPVRTISHPCDHPGAVATTSAAAGWRGNFCREILPVRSSALPPNRFAGCRCKSQWATPSSALRTGRAASATPTFAAPAVADARRTANCRNVALGLARRSAAVRKHLLMAPKRRGRAGEFSRRDSAEPGRLHYSTAAEGQGGSWSTATIGSASSPIGPIAPGEELFFDYRYGPWSSSSTSASSGSARLRPLPPRASAATAAPAPRRRFGCHAGGLIELNFAA